MTAGRRIFVGDIQGCCAELQALLAAVDFQTGQDQLYPVGDLVNKGPDSAAVLDLLMQLGAQPVLGNHDLSWLRKNKPLTAAQRQWLEQQPIVRVLPDLIMVHGGLHPEWQEADLDNLTEEQVNFAVNVRYCDAQGRRPASDWPVPEPPYFPWDHFYQGSRRVVFGHWARRGLVQTPKVIGLDSGCVYGKQLSAWIAEEDRLVQVPGWSGAEG